MEAGKGERAHQRSAAGAISVPSMVALEVGTLCGRAELGMPWPAPMLPWVFGGCCVHGGAKARRGFVLLGRLRRGRASLPSLWEVETLRLEPGGMFVGRSAPRANVPKGPGGA